MVDYEIIFTREFTLVLITLLYIFNSLTPALFVQRSPITIPVHLGSTTIIFTWYDGRRADVVRLATSEIFQLIDPSKMHIRPSLIINYQTTCH